MSFRKKIILIKTNSILDSATGQRVPLDISNCERDRGVMKASNGKAEPHVSSIANKANRMLGICVKTFAYITPEIARIMYLTFIRSQMEFAMPAWSPHLKGDIDKLEKVQRRATKRVDGLWH